MGERVTKLREHASGLDVPAVLHDLLTLDDLFTAEEQWCTHRIAVLRELASAGRHDASEGWPGSIHWSWATKAALCLPSRLNEFGDVRLFGIDVAGQWQALLFGLNDDHVTRLGTVGRPLVYVEFVEVAPWNWDIALLEKVGRYRSAGTQLMKLAVRWSYALGYKGRLGLHALPQAKAFYRARCRMRSFGPDANYDDMTYFELSEANAHVLVSEKP